LFLRTLLVGYDLNKPIQNYGPLIARLKAFEVWWHCLDSTWLLKTDLTAVNVRDALRPLIDASDELLVLDVTSDPWAWIGFSGDCGAWFSNNM
jgi:hypothetical protein